MSFPRLPTSPTPDHRADVDALFRWSIAASGHDALWVHAVGELDCVAAPRLKQVLSDANERARLVVLDLRDLTRVDSSGLGVIVTATVRARRSGHRLILIRGNSQIDQLLRATGAHADVEIIDLAGGEAASEPAPYAGHRGRGSSGGQARGIRRVVTFAPRTQAGGLPPPARTRTDSPPSAR